MRWSARASSGAESTTEPGAGDLDAGRTEMRTAVVEFEYDGDDLRTRHLEVAVRPEHARLLGSSTTPPGVYQPLPIRGSLELLAVAWTDLATGEARYRRRDGRARLVLPAGGADGDRHAEMRLFLDVAPSREEAE